MSQFTRKIIETRKNIKNAVLISIINPVSRHLNKSAILLHFNNNAPQGLIAKLFSKKNLAVTNIVSTAVLMLMGDIGRQEMEYHQKLIEKRYDWARAARMFTVALVLVGPIGHYYYTWLARTWPQRTVQIVLFKIVFDQFVISPVNITAFFFGMSALEMKNFFEAVQELREKFITIYTADWCVWPPAQFLNFYVIPVRFQVIYINIVTLLYSFILSYVKHMPMKK